MLKVIIYIVFQKVMLYLIFIASKFYVEQSFIHILDNMLRNFQDQLEKAEELRIIGTQLIESQHYAVDSIQPKCVELVRMRDAFHDRITKRLETLHKCRDLQERIERVSFLMYCT